MTLATFFLLLSVAGLCMSTITFFRIKLPGLLMVPQFFIGWLAGELALHTIIGQAVVTILFVAGGVLDHPQGQWGLGLSLVSWGLLAACHGRSLRAAHEIAEALAPQGIVPEQDVSMLHGFPNPFIFSHPDVRVLRDIPYGESLEGDRGGRNLMDIVLPEDASEGDERPVLLQVHGGGWLIGDKREQGRPLMMHLASRGWVCVAINYRLSPQAAMPAHIIDVKRSIAWIRAHIAEYGGNPDFVCITGGSAGGHLCSLAALSANDARFQPGFEEVDTWLDACVPFYGVFDFLDRADDRGKLKMGEMIGDRVFGCTPEENPELWDSVSPVTRTHPDAPPFFVIQGSHDSLVFAEEARTFVDLLREKSNAPVLHAELTGAQHAFEVFHSVRCAHAIRGVTAFLEKVHEDYAKKKTATA
ncbi:MAG: alpha/beta hydrolase [Deltaproteobacteria bacterium]|jgi:acetyl esterase/lipase|nr:alpha/beta hydrolase [Deltaproteobacteria bacterium]